MNQNRWAPRLLALLLAWCMVLPAFAVDPSDGAVDTTAAASESAQQEDTEQTAPLNEEGNNTAIQLNTAISSRSFFLVDNVTGTVLEQKNADEKREPAGLTKIVTLLVVLENGNLSDMVTVSEDAATQFGRDNGIIDLKTDEELTVQDLLYCMMLGPSNEAAVALAEYVSETESAFAEKMNLLAKNAGCENTNFVNATGLDASNQYSTARDMFRIIRYGMANPRFMDICSSVHKLIDPTNVTEKQRYFSTENRLVSKIKEETYYYGYAAGIISGYTGAAGYCLATTAQRDEQGMQLVCVAMGGSMITVTEGEEGTPQKEVQRISTYLDAKNAMVEAFENYEIATIASAGEVVDETKVVASPSRDSVTMGPDRDVKIILPKGAEQADIEKQVEKPAQLKAPVKYGDEMGTLTVLYKGEVKATYPLYAQIEVESSLIADVSYEVGRFFSNSIVRILIVLLILFVIFYIYITIQFNKKRQHQLKKQRKSEKRY